MILDDLKNSIVIGLHQKSISTLVGELALALEKNQQQAAEIADLKAQLSEATKPAVAPPAE